jgi:hypothetical protein
MTTARKEVTEVRATGVLNSEGTLREVVLGVDTHLNVHVTVSWMGSGQAPRRVEDTNDPQGLRTTPPLVAGFRSCKVRRSRGNRQLRR